MDDTMKNKNPKGTAVIVDAVTVLPADANTTTVRDSVVSIFPERPADPSINQSLRLVEQSGVLDFWNDSEEDVYTLEDGSEI